jgi:tetratricopeptide (TPR) repeat protein
MQARPVAGRRNRPKPSGTWFFLRIVGAAAIVLVAIVFVITTVAVLLSENSRETKLLSQAKQLLDQGKAEPAKEILLGLLKRNPRSTRANLLMAATLPGDPYTARMYVRAALDQQPKNKEALDALTAIYERIRALGMTENEEVKTREQEINDYQNVLKRNGSSAEALYRSASHRIAVHRLRPERIAELETAVVELQRAVSILGRGGNKNELASAHHQLGRAYKHQGDQSLAEKAKPAKAAEAYRRALDQFRNALSLDPNRADSLGEIILIHRSDGNPKQALESALAFLPAMTNQRAQAKSYEMIGTLQAELGDSVNAVATLQKALALDPSLLGTYMNLAEVYSGQRDYVRTEEILKRGVETEPHFIEAYERLGDLCFRQKQADAAVSWYEKLLRIRPEEAVFIGMAPSKNLYRNEVYYRASAMLAWLYLEHQSNPRKALLAVDYAKGYRDNDPHLLDTLGWIYYKTGDYERAKSVLEPLARDAAGDFPAVHFHLASTYYRQGNRDTAQRELEVALRSTGAFTDRAEAEALHKRLASAAGGPSLRE